MASHLAPAPSPGPRRGARTKGRPRRGRGVAPLVAAFVLLIIGGTFLLGPTVSAVIGQREVEQTVGQYQREVRDSSDGGSAGDGTEFRSKDDDPTYQKLVAYNEAVCEGTGDQINDPFAFSGDDLAELGLPDGIIGSIDIPSMGMTLPLYLGATEENMMKGATVIAGTSMPIGGPSSNCVIAAHRGIRGLWSGPQMFRDIELVQVGDTVTITTPWDVLTYRACEIRLISPDDVDALAIQDGRDLVTLFTCHPYGAHTQRYLVYCERVDNAEAQQSPGVVERAVRAFLPAPAEDSPSLTVEFVLRLVGLVLLVVTTVVLVVMLVRRLRAPRRGG